MIEAAPQEFKKVFRNMGPRFGEFAKSKEEYVMYSLIGLDQADAAVIRPFLDKILVSCSPGELRTWWREGTSTTYFTVADEVVEFLKIMRNILGKPPYTKDLN